MEYISIGNGFSVITIRTFIICKVAIFSIKHQSPYVDVWYRDIGKRRLCWHCGVLLGKVATGECCATDRTASSTINVRLFVYLDGGRDDIVAILSRVIASSHLLTVPLVMQNQELLHGPRMKGRGGVRVSTFT